MPISITDTCLSLNILNPNYAKGSDLPWSKRLPLLVELFHRSGATVFILQECDAKRAEDIKKAMGGGLDSRTSHINTIIWFTDRWKFVAQTGRKLPGVQERTLLIVKLEKIGSGGGYAWFAGSHLSVATSAFKVLITKAMALASRNSQYRAIRDYTGDALLGYQQILLGYDSNDSDGGRKVLEAAGWKHVMKDGTDEVAAKKRIRVTKVTKLPTRGGSDHKNALVVDFTATNA